MGCNCGGGGRDGQVTVPAQGQGVIPGEPLVRYVWVSPYGSAVPYRTPAEAQAAVDAGGGSWVKMDMSDGRVW